MWTTERVETVLRLWKSGRTATQIAAEVGGITRNAVIGLVHRRRAPPRPKRAAPPTPAEKPPREPKRSTALAKLGSGPLQLGPQPIADLPAERKRARERVDLVSPDVVPCTLLELRHDACRWPLGDPAAPEFRYCGGRADEGHPYCDYHARLAYQPRERRAAASGS